MQSISCLVGTLIKTTLRITFCQLTHGNNDPANPLLISHKFHCFVATIKQQRKQFQTNNVTAANRNKQHSGNNSFRRKHDDNMLNHLPFFVSGEIVRGFGRGSKELGIPTANYSLDVVKSLPATLIKGIYYGWANVDNGEVYKMVMSVGTNPYYDNKEKSMETHIIHKFDGDLYGHLLKVCIVGFLRPEKNFNSLQELIDAIHADIEQAATLLDTNEESHQLRFSQYFKENNEDNDDTTAPKTTCHNGDTLKNGS